MKGAGRPHDLLVASLGRIWHAPLPNDAAFFSRRTNIATLPPIADTAKVEVRMLNANQQIENVHFVYDSGGIDSTRMNAIADAVIAWWSAQVKPVVTGAVSLVSVKVTDLSTATGPVLEKAPATAQNGSSATTALPNEVSIALHKTTVGRGRSAKGRMYWPQLSTSQQQDANTINSGSAADLIARSNALITAINGLTGGTALYGYVSYYHDKALRGTPIFLAVSSFVLRDNTLDSQRRRGPGRGR